MSSEKYFIQKLNSYFVNVSIQYTISLRKPYWLGKRRYQITWCNLSVYNLSTKATGRNVLYSSQNTKSINKVLQRLNLSGQPYHMKHLQYESDSFLTNCPVFYSTQIHMSFNVLFQYKMNHYLKQQPVVENKKIPLNYKSNKWKSKNGNFLLCNLWYIRVKITWLVSLFFP